MLMSGVRWFLLPMNYDCRRSAVSSPAVCPAGYRQRRTNRTDKSRRAARRPRSFCPFPQNQLNCLKVSIMRQTDVAVPDFAPVPVPTFTSAMIRFVASLGMLIGISLLLASL